MKKNQLHHKSHQVVSKFFRIDIEPLRKFFEICGVWPNFLLDICHIQSKIPSYTNIFKKTSEVTSKSILINFQTMNFWSDSESLGGFCGVFSSHLPDYHAVKAKLFYNWLLFLIWRDLT